MERTLEVLSRAGPLLCFTRVFWVLMQCMVLQFEFGSSHNSQFSLLEQNFANESDPWGPQFCAISAVLVVRIAIGMVEWVGKVRSFMFRSKNILSLPLFPTGKMCSSFYSLRDSRRGVSIDKIAIFTKSNLGHFSPSGFEVRSGRVQMTEKASVLDFCSAQKVDFPIVL